MAWAFTFAVLVITNSDRWRQTLVKKFVNRWRQPKFFVKKIAYTLYTHFWFLKFFKKIRIKVREKYFWMTECGRMERS
jgi:hypothetical protein